MVSALLRTCLTQTREILAVIRPPEQPSPFPLPKDGSWDPCLACACLHAQTLDLLTSAEDPWELSREGGLIMRNRGIALGPLPAFQLSKFQAGNGF